MLLNNQWITEEIKEEMEKIPRNKWKRKNYDPTPMGCSKLSSNREVYSNRTPPQETRNISNKQPKHTPKATRESKGIWNILE